jgi:hypothetical protein
MSYTITFVQKKDYLHARIIADSTPENVLNSLSEIQQTCLNYKYRKVLIEDGFSGPTISTFDIFAIIEKMSPTISPEIQQIAYVDVEKKHDPESLRFAETVAVNRGVNIKYFIDIKLAEQWLENLSSVIDTSGH